MAPYVSIIGPSGIGKSFTVAQLALEHGLYVSYSSLVPGGSVSTALSNCGQDSHRLPKIRNDKVLGVLYYDMPKRGRRL